MANKYDIEDFLKDQRQIAANEYLNAEEAARIQGLIDCLDELEKPRDTTCEGCKNWETKVIWQEWIDSDDESIVDLWKESRSIFDLADSIESYIGELVYELGETKPSGLAAQALAGFLQEVSWLEIAEKVHRDCIYTDEYQHKGETYHIQNTTTDEIVFTGEYAAALAHFEKQIVLPSLKRYDSGELTFDSQSNLYYTMQEFRHDGFSDVGGVTYDLNEGEPETSEDESDDELPVRDMDDAGN